MFFFYWVRRTQFLLEFWSKWLKHVLKYQYFFSKNAKRMCLLTGTWKKKILGILKCPFSFCGWTFTEGETGENCRHSVHNVLVGQGEQNQAQLVKNIPRQNCSGVDLGKIAVWILCLGAVVLRGVLYTRFTSCPAPVYLDWKGFLES